MGAQTIDRIIRSVGDLPTLPTVYMKLSHLLKQPDAPIKSISNIISEDPAIAAMVLKIVNSAAYGFRSRIGDLQHAIVILGLKEIRNLVLAGSVYKMVKGFKSSAAFNMEEFWKHSIGCATMARVLAETATLGSPEEIFTGGLLHDIGKLIHATYLRDEYDAVIALVTEDGSQVSEAEQKLLGFDHAQTGGILARKWHLPEKTVDMIAYHHLIRVPQNPAKGVAAIHVANTLCVALRLGWGGEKRVPIVNPKAWEVLNLRLGDLEYMMQRALRLFEESVSIMEFD